ncbi:hypothetical protein FEV09_05395 [Pseudanabaena catenata USMAC16]|uniref:Uncharacterized protein n=2 Tax=Pseudanabaena TaxID=1152 RepID=L8N6H4_9CYAN|nr:hypothetical protein [Pseudanabaena catenata]ELS33828.1 hypothetical protein Pse7429DRAFT_1176 [Pseudanabaena biceps PCC 7429]MDG3493988.1 hypothetical protein [Pseudanabaena catenata USMAC16]
MVFKAQNGYAILSFGITTQFVAGKELYSEQAEHCVAFTLIFFKLHGDCPQL